MQISVFFLASLCLPGRQIVESIFKYNFHISFRLIFNEFIIMILTAVPFVENQVFKNQKFATYVDQFLTDSNFLVSI